MWLGVALDQVVSRREMSVLRHWRALHYVRVLLYRRERGHLKSRSGRLSD
jgi:hypothetical protein